MRILVAGDITGSPGRRAFAEIAGRYRREGRVEAVVANAENAAGGRGLTPRLAEELLAAGADVLSMGDHTWDQRELADYLRGTRTVIRPATFPPGSPGRGWTTVATDAGPLTVINLMGRVFMAPHDCPFRAADAILEDLPADHGPILVDMHAEATSEKIAMGWHLAGRVAAVVGTHTHVQTSDNRILPGGTAYITDLGMTGPRDSVLGRDRHSVVKRFISGMPQKFNIDSDSPPQLEGVLLEVNPATGQARSIERVRECLDDT